MVANRKIDLIDTRPRFVETDAIRLNNLFRGSDTQEMLRSVIRDGLAGDLAVVSSFGAESAVLLHLIAEVDPSVPVLVLETGKQFAETVAYRDELIGFLGMTNLLIIEPDAEAIAKKDENGLRWSWDPDGCCEIRKVEPLARAKRGLDAWISGRKAFQSVTRENLPRFEIEDGRLKINPLGDWTKDHLEAYFAAHDLPRHPLEAQGYLSVGCQPCTSVVKPGEDPRAGRWRGWDKTECGIHAPVSMPVGKPEAGDELPPEYEPVF